MATIAPRQLIRAAERVELAMQAAGVCAAHLVITRLPAASLAVQPATINIDLEAALPHQQLYAASSARASRRVTRCLQSCAT